MIAKRLPYHKYEMNGIEIRVGKSDRDNDVLSCNPMYRDDAFWWMHVDGFAGSHVVICTEMDVPSDPVILAAAQLATVHSKAKAVYLEGKVQPVTMVRCRDITKDEHAVAGLVRITSPTVAMVSADVKDSIQLTRIPAIPQKVHRSPTAYLKPKTIAPTTVER